MNSQEGLAEERKEELGQLGNAHAAMSLGWPSAAIKAFSTLKPAKKTKNEAHKSLFSSKANG